MAKPEVIKSIEIKNRDTNRTYVLDFNRQTVVQAENMGFSWDELANKPATMIPIIWYCAFRRYDMKISKQQTDKIFEDMGGVTPEIITRLRELYDQALISLINVGDDDEDGADEKNATWGITL